MFSESTRPLHYSNNPMAEEESKKPAPPPPPPPPQPSTIDELVKQLKRKSDPSTHAIAEGAVDSTEPVLPE